MALKIENRLNDLSGREWLYWTSSVYETSFPPDATHRLRKAHGAMKPPELMAEILSFFTKAGEHVLDPFAGVGGTLLGAALSERVATGIELHPRWVEVYRTIQTEFVVHDGRLLPKGTVQGRSIEGRMIPGDCLTQMARIKAESIDAIVTDPPYGWQHGATGFRDETNFNMLNPQEGRDFSNAPDLHGFLSLMQEFGHACHRILKPQRYLVVLIGDRFMGGEYVPLGIHVAQTLRQCGFQFKGMRLWWNKATQRPLKPYAVKMAFVPNIVHQNILVLRRNPG